MSAQSIVAEGLFLYTHIGLLAVAETVQQISCICVKLLPAPASRAYMEIIFSVLLMHLQCPDECNQQVTRNVCVCQTKYPDTKRFRTSVVNGGVLLQKNVLCLRHSVAPSVSLLA